MNETSPSFWSHAVRSLAARMPPWPILALVAGHLALHAGTNSLRDWRGGPPSTELLIVPLCFCQMSLLVVWLTIGSAPGPLRFLALFLVTFLHWIPCQVGIVHSFPASVLSLFWPWHPDVSEIVMFFGYGAFELSMLGLAAIVHFLFLGAPLALLQLGGLRITVVNEATNPTRERWQFSIASLLLWTATAAVGLAVARQIHFHPIWNFEPQTRVLPQSLKWGAVTLPAVACALHSTLGVRLNRARLAALILLSFLLSALLWWLFHGSEWPTSWDRFEWPVATIWTGPLVITVVSFVSLLVVRYSGYRLTWRRPARLTINSASLATKSAITSTDDG